MQNTFLKKNLSFLFQRGSSYIQGLNDIWMNKLQMFLILGELCLKSMSVYVKTEKSLKEKERQVIIEGKKYSLEVNDTVVADIYVICAIDVVKVIGDRMRWTADCPGSCVKHATTCC